MSDNAIEIINISKSYQSGVIRGLTFLQDIQSRWAKIRGKEDPNSRIIGKEELNQQSTFTNKRFWAVRNVSFNVREGETIALLGKNGAGKSTLLQVLCRITEADSGVIRVKGRVASLLGAGVGFNEEMTGRENVYLNGSILGMTAEHIDSSILDIFNFAELTNFIDTPIKRYSSGMKSRLGFSVAVHLDCDIMVLDEVFAAGDKVFRQKCVEKMKELSRSGRTIIIVIHLPEMMREVCERGVVLRDGENVFDGDIEEAINNYLTL